MNRGEIEVSILIAHPLAPGLNLAAEHLAILAFGTESQHARSLGRVEERIEFYHGNFLPLRCIADLVVANHRRASPSRDYVGANVPDHRIPSLARGD